MSDVIQNLPKVVEAYRRSAFNPIAGLTPEKLSRQLTDFKAGTLRDLALTMDAIEERDDTLAGVVPKAKSAVARHGYEIVVNEHIPAGMEAQAEAQREALQYFYDHIRAENALEGDEVGEFSLLVRQMMDAKGKRYAAHHIVWASDGPGRYHATLIHVPLWFFEARTGKLRYIAEPYGYDGVPLDPGAWMVSVGQGLMRACAVAWMFKRLSLNDWVGYCDKIRLPRYPRQDRCRQGHHRVERHGRCCRSLRQRLERGDQSCRRHHAHRGQGRRHNPFPTAGRAHGPRPGYALAWRRSLHDEQRRRRRRLQFAERRERHHRARRCAVGERAAPPETRPPRARLHVWRGHARARLREGAHLRQAAQQQTAAVTEKLSASNESATAAAQSISAAASAIPPPTDFGPVVTAFTQYHQAVLGRFTSLSQQVQSLQASINVMRQQIQSIAAASR